MNIIAKNVTLTWLSITASEVSGNGTETKYGQHILCGQM